MVTIDLISFLKNYYGIYHSKLSFDNLKHEDILELFPFINVCNNKDVKIEELAIGNIVGVYDKTNRVVFYHNPHCSLDTIDFQMIEDTNDENKMIVVKLEDLENLSKEELLKLRRKLRINNQRKDSYMINTLIRKLKKKEPRKYRREKEKLLIKEKENYYD